MLYRPIPQQALRAELVGSNRCTAAGFTASGQAPVLALCRELIAAGLDPDQPLEIHLGATLALRVRSIGEAARLAVEDNKTGRPTFRRWRNRPARDGAAPPIAPIVLRVVSSRGTSS
jgi:hypothetical protein